MNPSPPPSFRPLFPLVLFALLLCAGPVVAQFTAPPRGLNTLTGRTLSFGYLNALRNASGTTAQRMAALNYDGVDVVLLAFASLSADGTLSMGGNAAAYRSDLVANAHARSKSVLFSVTGDFATVAASPALRQTLANSVLTMLEQHGFDGVDFDWEWRLSSGSSARPARSDRPAARAATNSAKSNRCWNPMEQTAD